MTHRIYVYFVFLLSFLVALPAQADEKDYKLGSGDTVHITVYDHPEMTLDARVGGTGLINYPFIGAVKIGGMTVREAEDIIAKKLSSGGYLKQPDVNVIVTQYLGTQVDVLGQVNRPGMFPLQRTTTLSDALALAGGVTQLGANHIILLRKEGGKTVHETIDLHKLYEAGDVVLNQLVQDGDILYVPRAPQFYIYGQVNRPGQFRLERNMTVAQALSVGGGLTQQGTQRGIKILRRDANGKLQELPAKLSDLLQKDDVVYVKEALF